MSDPDTGKQDDNAALIALRDLPSQLRDDAIGHAPRRAERLLAAADEIERLRRELAEVQTKYGLLSSAINESTDECGPDCDDYGHGDKCPSLDPERWLIDQQATIEGLRRELAEAERDALRYRWLMADLDAPSVTGRFSRVYRQWSGEDGAAGFTAVLDAAMQEDER